MAASTVGWDMSNGEGPTLRPNLLTTYVLKPPAVHRKRKYLIDTTYVCTYIGMYM
jgi:hypothetical protein